MRQLSYQKTTCKLKLTKSKLERGNNADFYTLDKSGFKNGRVLEQKTPKLIKFRGF